MKKTEKSTALPAAECWRLTLRCWWLFWRLCPSRFISSLLSTAFSSLSPYAGIWLSAQLVDELAGGRDPLLLRRWTLLLLGSAALLTLVSAALDHWWRCTDVHIESLIESRLYAGKMMSLDFADIDSQHIYDLYTQIRQSRNFNGWGPAATLPVLDGCLRAIFRIAGGIALSVSLFAARVPAGGQLAWLGSPLTALAVVLLMLGVSLLSPYFSGISDSYWARYTPMARFGNRYFSFYCFDLFFDRRRMPDIRIYRQFDNVAVPYTLRESSFGPGSWLAQRAKGAMGLWVALSSLLSSLLVGLIYLFVCLKAWAGAFGVGAVTQYIGAVTSLFAGLSGLLKALGILRTNGEFVKPFFQLYDTPNRMYRGSLTTEKRADRQYEVEFRDVSFRYPGSDSYALRHVSMKFRVGSRLAIVGMNGSGKTTFIKLLCRLYDPTEGEILLNGIDIRKYRYDEYIGIFSVVFQDFRLLALPLGENVAAGTVYDAGRAADCLTKAGFAGRLAQLPDGLDTPLYRDLDPAGVEISGGEAQKIAIARALYKDAPFIILDEPTAALDPIAEAEIYEKFNDIAGDRTAVYISHRLSPCKFCDEIAVFDAGAIVQQGTHEALVADESGRYHELWHAQAQYYTERG